MESWPGATVGVAYTLTGVSFAMVISRNILRRLKHEDQKLDDYIMLGSLAFYGVSTATNPVAYFNGTNARVVHARELSSDEVQHAMFGSLYIIIGHLFYVTFLWICKGCMLIFYWRVITDNHLEQVAVKGTSVLLGVTWLAAIFVVFLRCDPLTLYWQVLPDPPQCARGVANTLTAGFLNIFTNVVLMILPIGAIRRAKFPVRSLLHISTAFIVNILLIIMVIMKMIIVHRSKLQWQAQDLICRQVDCFLMTVLVNKPIHYRLWRHGFNHIRKGKFGMDSCSTGYSPPVENQAPRKERNEGVSGLVGKFRTSAHKFGEKTRRSVGFQTEQIERTVELLQTSRTGNFEEDDEEMIEPRDDYIFGGKSGPIAKIKTTISRSATATPSNGADLNSIVSTRIVIKKFNGSKSKDLKEISTVQEDSV